MTEQERGALTTLSDADPTLDDSASDVRGRTVADKAGQEIGKIDELLVDDQEWKVRFLRVEAGGFLGIGARHFLIPVDAITNIDQDRVHIDQTREHVIGAPPYDPNVVAEAPAWNDHYAYYGYAPYWAPGYGYPPYPYYR